MFEFSHEINWQENKRDKMITFINLYRKELKEPLQDIQYKNTDDEKRIIIYFFKDIEITFKSFESSRNSWIIISVEVDTEDKIYFDSIYNSIMNIIEQIRLEEQEGNKQ